MLISLSYFLIFIIIYIYSYLYLCIYTFILPKKFKAMEDVHLCIRMYVCVYKFHSETQVPLLLFRRTTRSNPPRMFFECRRRG